MAALKSRTFGCPECDGEFTILLADTDPLPSHCPLCGEYVGADPEPIPYFSRVGQARHQSLDKTYRAMESASYARAEEAASEFGGKASDYENVRITNMKDNLREGDTSAILPTPKTFTGPPPPSNVMPMAPMQAAGMVQKGNISPGTQVLDTIRPNFATKSKMMARAGEMGRYSGK